MVTDLKTYKYQAEMLIKDFSLADSLLPFISVLTGIVLSKMACELTRIMSSCYFISYSALSKMRQKEWCNRGMSSIHAIYITTISLFLVFFSDLYSDNQLEDLITFRNSPLSNFTLGVSVGYFSTDLAMICMSFPSLGGMEFVLHHVLSLLAISYSMFSGEGQLYTFMALISEATTPGVNLRWYLDVSGKKKSSVYVLNGVLIVFQWLVARILLFMYFFYHVFRHYDQVEEMHICSYVLVFAVPFVLTVMNTVWFVRILKGLMKAITKSQ